jgi:hypothetical protein
MHIMLRLILELMGDQGRDLDSLIFLQSDLTIFKDHRPFTFQDMKELSCFRMGMHYLRAASRDAFADHTHLVALEQMPAITDFTPDVVFSGLYGNEHCHKLLIEDEFNCGIFSILAQIF